MDLYTTIKPLYYFGKFTGIATYTFDKNCGFEIRTRDKLLTLAISSAWLIITLYSFSLTTFEPTSAITLLMIVSNLATSLDTAVSFPTMYKNSTVIFKNIYKLSQIDESIGPLFRRNLCYLEMRKNIIQKLILYIIMLVCILAYSIYVFCFIIKEGTLHSFLYFTGLFVFAYLLNMSKMCLLIFFTDILTRRLQLVNDILSKSYTLFKIKNGLDKDSDKAIQSFMKIHRCLCQVSKDVNTIFQMTLLGKVSICSMSVLLCLFVLITGIIGFTKNGFMGLSMIFVASRYTSEVVGIVYQFWKLRVEVSIKI